MKAALSTFLVMVCSSAWASDYRCEVMMIKGSAYIRSSDSGERRPLSEGDLLKEGDTLEISGQSYVDLAFDAEWNNVGRVWGKAEIQIRSLFPTDLSMENGDLLARLKKLPEKSTFEVQTPTAIAAVRGSAFRVVHHEGVTDVFNLASSPVEVFKLDEMGRMMRSRSVLSEHQRTRVSEGEALGPAQKMSVSEIRDCMDRSGEMETLREKAISGGRLASIQSVERVNRDFRDNLSLLDQPLDREGPDSENSAIKRPADLDQTAVRSPADRIGDMRDFVDRSKENLDRNRDRMQREKDRLQRTQDRDQDRTINSGGTPFSDPNRR